MTGLPPGWSHAAISELASPDPHATAIGPFGSNLKVSDYTGEGVPLVFVRQIRRKSFDEPQHFVSAAKAKELAAHSASPGDLLVTKMGAPPGDAAVLNGARDVIITADCIKVSPHTSIDARYLAYGLESDAARAQIAEMTSGVAQQKVSLAKFRHLRLPVPPSQEQRRIVDEIERRLSHVDAAVSGLRTASRRLTAARSAVLHEAFWAPRHPLVSLSDLVVEKLANGRSVKDRANGFPVLRLTCLKDGRIDLSASKAGDWDRSQAERFLVRPGDFLVSRGNGSLHLVARGGLVMGDVPEVAYPDTLIRIRVDPDKVLPEYLAAVWASGGVRQQLEAVARTTAGIYKVNQGHLEAIEVPTPPIDSQAETLAELDRRTSLLDAAERTIASSLAKAGQLRRSLLHAAFSGQLVPQDPADEPASVLLERIAAARAAAAPTKPTRRAKKDVPA